MKYLLYFRALPPPYWFLIRLTPYQIMFHYSLIQSGIQNGLTFQ